MNLCIQCPTHLWLSKVFSYLSMIIFFTPKRCTNQWLPPIPVQQFPNVSPNIFGISIRELGNPHFNRKLFLVICSIRSTDNPMISTWYAMIIRHTISIRYLCIDPYIYIHIYTWCPHEISLKSGGRRSCWRWFPASAVVSARHPAWPRRCDGARHRTCSCNAVGGRGCWKVGEVGGFQQFHCG